MGLSTKLFGICVFVLIFGLLLPGCSGGGNASDTNNPNSPSFEQRPTITVLGKTIEIPEGVEPGLVRELAEALESAVSSKQSSSAAPPSNWLPFEKIMEGEFSTFSWDYQIPGDYNQDGEVGVADITPIALGFGLGEADEAWSDFKTIDGDLNGEINLADLALIVQYFGASGHGAEFIIEKEMEIVDGSGPYLKIWEHLSRVPFSTHTKRDYSSPPHYEHTTENEGSWKFRIRLDLSIDPPYDFTATFGEQADSIKLEWEEINGATAYELYRDTKGLHFAKVQDVTNYVDESVEFGRIYSYWIKAIRYDETSDFSKRAVGMAIEWQSHEIDGSLKTGHRPSLALIGGNPAVSYYNNTDASLWYAASNTPYPVSAGDWQLHPLTSYPTDSQSGLWSNLLEIDGLPLVSYVVNNGDFQLKLARGNNSRPQTITDWQTSGICDQQANAGTGRHQLLNGMPVAFYIHYPDHPDNVLYRQVMYTRATTSNPTGPHDWVATPVSTGENIGTLTKLKIHNGKPVMIWHNEIEEDVYRLMYARALVAEPTGEKDWVVSEIDLIGRFITWTDLEIVAGHPAVLFNDELSEIDSWRVMYARASVAEPSGPDDWEFTHLDEPALWWTEADLAVVNGTPAAVYTKYYFNQGEPDVRTIHLAWAAVPDPQVLSDWAFSDLVEVGGHSYYTHISVADQDGLPIVAYRDYLGDGESRLRYISAVQP